MTDTITKSLVGVGDLKYGTGTFARPTSTGGSDTITKFGAIWESLLDDQTAALVMTTLGITAYAQTILDDADAATARATLGVIASAFIRAGTIEIDGDKLDIDWTPSNYTPATTPTEVGNVAELTAHLYGIDQAFGSLVDLSETVTAKTSDYVLLAADLYGNKTFTNNGAGAEINFTWPTLAAGQCAHFNVVDAQYLKITAPTGKTFRYLADESAAAGYIRSNTVGNFLTVRANADDLVLWNPGGTWNYDE